MRSDVVGQRLGSGVARGRRVLVEIEADIGPGLPGLHLVGLPDTALSEARDRVRAAVLNSAERWPPRRMTLALSSAALPKGASSYDLALACSLLAADRQIPVERLRGLVLIAHPPAPVAD